MAKVKNLFVREQMIDDSWAMTTVVGQRGRVHAFTRSRDATGPKIRGALRIFTRALTRTHCAQHDSPPLFENSNNSSIP